MTDRKKEEEARKKMTPGVSDPYYEQYIKNSFDQEKEEKAKK